MKYLAILILLLTSAVAVGQTTAKGTQSASHSIMPSPQPVDTTLTPVVPFTPMAVSMHGYAKRLNDSRESFVLRNETRNYRISRVLLKLIYTTDNGSLLHSREELIECDIAPGMTQMVAIKSFDTSKIYYYHTLPPQRASGTPYRIKYDVLRYDVVVE